MTLPTVFLVTGANRGIGFGLAASLLLRPASIVIATIRSVTTSTKDLEALPVATDSRIIITVLSSTSETDAESVVSSLSEQGITHIDTIIASAGVGKTFEPSLLTSIDSLRENFETNTLGPIKLFQATYPLLKEAANPKFILVSSSLGSIGDMEGNTPTLAYGVSKAGANYFVRKLHYEHDDITTVAVHPGWVKTSNGQAFADAIGVSEPPLSLKDSVRAVLEQVDAASRTTTSGSFISYDGTVILW